eukprot:s504_g22.t1
MCIRSDEVRRGLRRLRIHISPGVCASDAQEVRRGLRLTPSDEHVTTGLCVRHARSAEGVAFRKPDFGCPCCVSDGDSQKMRKSEEKRDSQKMRKSEEKRDSQKMRKLEEKR